MENLKTISKVLFIIITLSISAWFMNESYKNLQDEQRIENHVDNTNYYYLTMEQNERGNLMGILTPFETLTNSEINSFKGKTTICGQAQHIHEDSPDYHFSERWLWKIPKNNYDVYIDEDWNVDIYITDIKRLSEVFTFKRFVTYELVKMNAWERIKEIMWVNRFDDLPIAEITEKVNYKLEQDFGFRVNLKPNNLVSIKDKTRRSIEPYEYVFKE